MYMYASVLILKLMCERLKLKRFFKKYNLALQLNIKNLEEQKMVFIVKSCDKLRRRTLIYMKHLHVYEIYLIRLSVI